MNEPPWRMPLREQFPGVPAWGASTTTVRPEPFEVIHFSGITPEWAWQGAEGDGVRVCVVDTGVESTHPMVGILERTMTVVRGPDDIETVDECPPVDLVGHGTACAGLIRSIAPRATIASVRVLTDGMTGSGSALIAGLRWAIDEGYDVVNLSLATTRDELRLALHELADRAYFRRCLLVVSAHNMPVRSYPWSFSSVLSVASHDEQDPTVHYYNSAPPVEFYARGVRVPVAWRGGGQIRTTGNSFAAPHISGLCALILSKHPWLTPFQLKSVLYSTARNVATVGGGAACQLS